jgi:hypothetical protein
MTDPRISLLLHQLHQAFDRRSWHGPNLMGSLRGVSLEMAGWRPQPERHNIGELVVHAAYWKYRVVRLIAADPPRAFSLPGSDFFARPAEPTADAWREDLALLREWHERLAAAVAALSPARLDELTGEFTCAELVTGAAAHDLYHAGQIRLLRRMYGTWQ